MVNCIHKIFEKIIPFDSSITAQFLTSSINYLYTYTNNLLILKIVSSF